MTKVLAVGIVFVSSGLLAGQSTPTLAVYTAEQAARGEIAMRVNALSVGNGFGACSDCHAEGLKGRVGDQSEVPSVASLKPGVQNEIAKARGRIPDLVGPAFRARWSNRSVQALIVNFKQRFAPMLSDETRLDILAYVLSENGFRPGPEPLTMDTDVVFRLLARSDVP